jgi:DNA-binding CsgD family transcriptional regulator
MDMEFTLNKKSLDHITSFYLRDIIDCTSQKKPNICLHTKSKELTRRHYYGSSYLTSREFECVKLLLTNKKMKEIGVDLGLSKRTIEFYLKNVRKRYSLNNRAHVIDYFKSLISVL